MVVFTFRADSQQQQKSDMLEVLLSQMAICKHV